MTDYVGLDLTDIAACYRHRGLQIADKATADKPLCVVNLEFYANGEPRLSLFGATEDMVQRECLAPFLESIAVLSDAAAGCNSESAN